MKRKNFVFNVFAIIIFFIASVSTVAWYMKTGTVYELSDFSFHASRVQQIFYNLKQGYFFTFISTNVLQQTGVATFLFYPSAYLYIWALFLFHFSYINSFYIWYTLITFIAFLISYFSMLSFSKNNFRSLVFAFFYVFVPYRLYLGRFVFGEFLASTFLPLVFLGFYEVIFRNNKKWYLLSIGLALVAYAHILSVFMIFEFFIIFFFFRLFSREKLSFTRIKSLFFSTLLTVCLVLPIIIPFLTDYLGKNILAPQKGIGILNDASIFLDQSFSNISENSSIGLILLITLFFGWKWTTTKIEKESYFIGVVFVLISTSIFPWKSFDKTFLATIQLPFRYLLYASLFLSIVASSKADSIYKFKSINKYLLSLMIMFLGLLSFYGSTSVVGTELYPFNSGTYLKSPTSSSVQILQPAQLDFKNYTKQFSYAVPYGETDYYPKVAKAYSNSIINNIAYINKKQKKIALIGEPNSLKFKLKLSKKSIINSPVLAYTHSYLKINGRNENFITSKRGTVQFNLNKGNYTISIGYKAPLLYYISLIVAIISWITLLTFLLFFKKV